MKYFGNKSALIGLNLLISGSALITNKSVFPHHSWATLDTNMISVADTFEQESLSQLDHTALTKKLRQSLKEALNLESQDSEVGTIKAMQKAKSVRNIEASLATKID